MQLIMPKISNSKELSKKHPKGWCQKTHYMGSGGQCGQSCPCCRAEVYNAGIDRDAKFGACLHCIKVTE